MNQLTHTHTQGRKFAVKRKSALNGSGSIYCHYYYRNSTLRSLYPTTDKLFPASKWLKKSNRILLYMDLHQVWYMQSVQNVAVHVRYGQMCQNPTAHGTLRPDL